MRTHAKPIAKVGSSRALMYRSSVMSAMTDLEALVDAYGADALHTMINQIASDLAVYGDSINNSKYNIWLNTLPYPKHRKQNKPENKRRSKAAA